MIIRCWIAVLCWFGIRRAKSPSSPSVSWDLLPYSFDVGWFRVNGEDYLTRINVPGREAIPPFSLALTDLVSETSSHDEVPVVATARPPCLLCRQPYTARAGLSIEGDSEKLHKHVR